MSWLWVVIVFAGAFCFCAGLLVVVCEETPEEKIHRKQQKALKAHQKQRELENRKALQYWRERAMKIKPGRGPLV